MILLLAPSGHPLRDLLPQALDAGSFGSELLSIDPAAADDLEVVLRSEGGEIQGQLETNGRICHWHELRGAWSALDSAPAPGSPCELLIQGLDLTPIPVVGRPSVVENLQSSRRLDECARAAGLGAKNAATHAKAPARRTASIWCGHTEFHGTSEALRPWLPQVGSLTECLGMIWGRIDFRELPAGPPQVLSATEDAPLPHSIDELSGPQRNALFALVERFQHGQLHAMPRESRG